MRSVTYFLIALLGIASFPALGAEDVSFTTADGVTIRGTYHPPVTTAAPALLLLHMLGKSRHSWDDFAGELNRAGYAVLAIDFRGHGESTTTPQGDLRVNAMTEREFSQLPEDARAAVAWLRSRPEINGNKLGIIGASIGANVALVYAATDPQIRAVALLSPGSVYRGIEAQAALRSYGTRPVLMVAAEDDNYSLVSVRALDSLVTGKKETLLLPDGGHGTYLLGKRPELSGTLINFMDSQLR